MRSFTYLFLANHEEVRYNCTIIDLHDRVVCASITQISGIASDLAIRTLQRWNRSASKIGLILHS